MASSTLFVFKGRNVPLWAQAHSLVAQFIESLSLLVPPTGQFVPVSGPAGSMIRYCSLFLVPATMFDSFSSFYERFFPPVSVLLLSTLFSSKARVTLMKL